MTRSLYSDLAGESAAHRHLSDEAFLTGLLTVESALSVAAARAGALSDAEAATAVETIRNYHPDLEEISRQSAEGANPTIPVVKALKAIDPTGIHPGATSQDIIDTSLMLCLRDATGEIIAELGELADLLAELTRTHRDTLMMAHTLGQQAVPTTVGCITAGWLQAVLRSRAALQELRFEVSYGGAAGTMTATHPHGFAIQDALAAELGLHNSGLVWHSDRIPVTTIAAALATAAGAVRKIAGDVIFLSASEISELREAQPGGSSAMPHKANPAAAIACDGYARRVPGLLATLFDALDCRLQRGTGSWHAEWQTIRELAAATASAVGRCRRSIDGIVVDTDRMEQHLTGTDVGHAPEIADRVLELYEGK